MASTESESGVEDEYSMVPVSLSTPPFQELPLTINNDDHHNPQSQIQTAGLHFRTLLVNVKLKFMAIKRVIEDKFLHEFCFPANSDRPRAYQVWPGNNVFFFHGRLVCGPDPRGLILTTLSILISSWIFAMYTADNFPHRRSLIIAFSAILTVIVGSSYMIWLVLVNLLLVSSTDPGIIERSDQASIEEIGTSRGPRRKRVTVNGVELKLKYCQICKIFRPPRTCHCAICNNCVERFDHHCPWIGQCIGLRNYRFYLMFVTSALIFFIYIFAFSCRGIHLRMSKTGTGLLGVLRNCPETIALAALSFAAILLLGGLVIFHAFLVSINQTGYENYRQSYLESQNPFDRGILGNIKEILFSPMPRSRVDFRAEVLQLSV